MSSDVSDAARLQTRRGRFVKSLAQTDYQSIRVDGKRNKWGERIGAFSLQSPQCTFSSHHLQRPPQRNDVQAMARADKGGVHRAEERGETRRVLKIIRDLGSMWPEATYGADRHVAFTFSSPWLAGCASCTACEKLHVRIFVGLIARLLTQYVGSGSARCVRCGNYFSNT
jgi:hypothetical protein